MIQLSPRHYRDHYGVYVLFRKDRQNENIARVSQVIEIDSDGYTRRNFTKEYRNRPISTKKEYQELRLAIASRCDCFADDIQFMIHDPSVCYDELGRLFPVDRY